MSALTGIASGKIGPAFKAQKLVTPEMVIQRLGMRNQYCTLERAQSHAAELNDELPSKIDHLITEAIVCKAHRVQR